MGLSPETGSFYQLFQARIRTNYPWFDNQLLAVQHELTSWHVLAVPVCAKLCVCFNIMCCCLSLIITSTTTAIGTSDHQYHKYMYVGNSCHVLATSVHQTVCTFQHNVLLYCLSFYIVHHPLSFWYKTISTMREYTLGGSRCSCATS